MKRTGFLTTVGAIVLAFMFFSPAVILYTDYLWFSSLGLDNLFRTVLISKLSLFAVAAIVSIIFIYLNYLWVKKATDSSISKKITIPAILILGVFLGLNSWTNWELVLRFIHQVSFNLSEPFGGTSVDFFVYALPFYKFLLGFAFNLIFFTALFCLALYAFSFGINRKKNAVKSLIDLFRSQRKGSDFATKGFISGLKNKANRHFGFLGFFFLATIAGQIFLSRYDLFFSSQGAVFGVGYAGANVLLPLLSALAALAGLAAFCSLLIAFGYDKKLLVYSGSILGVVAVAGFMADSLVRSYVVDPDEFNKEKSFVSNQIDMTRKGFALNQIDEQQFKVTKDLNREEIEQNKPTIENLRLWDYRPLSRTYNQIQNFRTYYLFNDMDTDRYKVNGNTRQVMLSAREMDTDSLSGGSNTWVNRHLVYTHGFGLAMSPVSKVSEEGFPEFYIKDIPPKVDKEVFRVDQPRIYYGEKTDEYAIVNTDTSELDYPSGNKNKYNNYDAEGGVQIDSLLDRVLFAYRFASSQILFSGSITTESRIQFNRKIQQRVRKVAPFLQFDDDPYLVLSDGNLYWVYDAYTTSSRFPYSEYVNYQGKDINYMRNSVKVAVNAYTGNMNFYIANKEDPLIQTYENIFPDLFQPMSEMDDSLKSHIRYPEDYFTIQTRSYFDYHMTDPKVFYNKEDQWKAPQEKLRGRTSEVEPYYVMMKLPGEDKAEFMLVQPFRPKGRENMIGWVAARSDEPNYGEMRSYLFSKQELIYGPAQIESRIDQDPEISQKMTLWSQQGSSVFRGNLLAIPINDSMMYFEPIFLQSSSKGSIPQLKRVIIAQGDKLTMEPTVEEVLDKLFKLDSTQTTSEATPDSSDKNTQQPAGISTYQLRQLKDLYQQAKESLNQGKLKEYSDRMDQFENQLNQFVR